MALMRVLVVLTLALVAATGCGRRGALEPPPGGESGYDVKADPGARPEQRDTFEAFSEVVERGEFADQPGLEPEKMEVDDATDKRFILDPLI